VVQCKHCGAEIEATFRFCPWCAGPQRRKLVEFFPGAEEDEHRALRVSRYLLERRVRFSVWDETGTARAAVSLDDDEASRLAAFLAPPRTPARPSLLDELRTLVRR
jgi:zinc-ribbon domain